MKKYLFGLLIIVLSTKTGYAQSDTITVSEEKNQADEKYDRMYKRYILDRPSEPAEIKHLWKTNLIDLGLLMPNIDFEQKFGNWSSDSYVKIGVDWWENIKFISKWEVSQQLKFYYNTKHRKKMGRKTNGFSGNYFSLNIFGGEKQNAKPALNNETTVESELFYGVGLSYGLQRRISNIGYIEISGGPDFRYRKISGIEVNNISNSNMYELFTSLMLLRVKAGFALDSFSKKHKLLK
jgi:hypothetical protein